MAPCPHHELLPVSARYHLAAIRGGLCWKVFFTTSTWKLRRPFTGKWGVCRLQLVTFKYNRIGLVSILTDRQNRHTGTEGSTPGEDKGKGSSKHLQDEEHPWFLATRGNKGKKAGGSSPESGGDSWPAATLTSHSRLQGQDGDFLLVQLLRLWELLSRKYSMIFIKLYQFVSHTLSRSAFTLGL